MKFISLAIAAALSSISAVNGVHNSADIYFHEKPALGASMWHFSADGLTIYSPKGDVLKAHRKSTICKPYVGYSDTLQEDCYYFTMKSDGHKYVWAASMTSPPRVDAFDIDTGEYAGYHETCAAPLDLAYHPARNEMWLRCAQQNEDNTGEIDVFSSGSLSSDHELIHLNGTSRPYGRIAVHSEMGPYAYASSYNMNHLSELNLSTKKVVEEYTIPKAHGSYGMVFSPKNEHLYMRARVCCTCGPIPEADVESCGRYGPPTGSPVLVQTGPSASLNPQNGTCGGGCLGSSADTIGVAEFDTVSKTFVGEHNVKAGTGFGADPIASPDGQHILLLPADGGKYVRVLKPGQNGASSSFVKDIPVNFQGGTSYETGKKGSTVITDYAFITDSTRNILVLASSEDNNIAIVDIADNFRMKKLNLAPAAAESTELGSDRRIEWAVSTNYVWISGRKANEQYIVEIPSNIDSARLHRTIKNIKDGGDILFVNNYERVRAVQLMNSMINGALTDVGTGGVGTAGLAVGCVALVAALGALYVAQTRVPLAPQSGENGQKRNVL